MPIPRRQRTRSPRNRIANSTVSGAPDRLTIPTAEGLAVCNAMNCRAKLPPLMAKPMASTTGSRAGTRRSIGNSTASTISERITV